MGKSSKKSKRRAIDIIFTVISIICCSVFALVALVEWPSAASIVFLVSLFLALPLGFIRGLWRKLPASKVLKPIIIAVLFFVGIWLSPSKDSDSPLPISTIEETTVDKVASDNSNSAEAGVSETNNNETPTKSSEATPTPVAIAINSATPTVTPTTAPKATATPTAAITSKPTSAPTSTVKEAPKEIVTKLGKFDIKNIPAYSGSPYVVVNGNTPYFSAADLKNAASSYEIYSDLDSKGRCGACAASVGKDIMPTEQRGEIGSVKPSGWSQAKYAGLVDGNYLYNRCHLIGYQLTGENANERNLITGTRYLNVDGMLPFENMVADYVKETGNHVLYRVVPIFEGNNLLASGVLMEAKSVEDNGEGILFCVFCYNIQPGVTIDYGDGSSRLAQEVNNTPTPTIKPTSTPRPTPTPVVGAQKYAVNNKNGKIHAVGSCPATDPNSDKFMTDAVYFGTYEEALAYSEKIAPKEDKRKCGNCWR